MMWRVVDEIETRHCAVRLGIRNVSEVSENQLDTQYFLHGVGGAPRELGNRKTPESLEERGSRHSGAERSTFIL